MIVTAAALSGQLNLSDPTEDTLLNQKIRAAQGHVERLLGFKIEEEYGGDGQDEIPPALIEAVSQLAAHWYEERQSVLVGVNAQEMPHGLWDVVNEYRRWSWSDD